MRISDWSSDVCSSDLLDRRDPDARGRDDLAGGEGIYLDGADLARERARWRAHHHRASRPPSIERPQAGATTLLRWGRLWPAARRRKRAPRRSLGPGVRDRGPEIGRAHV